MNCEKAGELMSLRLDDMLDDTSMSRLLAHIEDCSRCAEEWRRLEEVNSLLAGWHAPKSPEGMTGDILEAARRRGSMSTRRKAAMVWWAAAAAVLAAVIWLTEMPGHVSGPVVVAEVHPMVPPETAEMLVRLSPSAGRAVKNLGAKVASSVEQGGDSVTRYAFEASDEFKKASLAFSDQSLESIKNAVFRKDGDSAGENGLDKTQGLTLNEESDYTKV